MARINLVNVKSIFTTVARDWILLNPLFWAGALAGYYSMYGMGHFQHGLIWVILGIVPIIGLVISLTPRFTQERIYRKYAESLKLKGNERVLDFGCGPGKLTKQIAYLVPNGHVTGIDIDSHSIVVAKKRLAGFDNVDFIQENIVNLPKPVEPYDVIVTQFVLHDITPMDREKIFKALKNWIKIDATLHIREPTEYIDAEEMRKQLETLGFTQITSITIKIPFPGSLYQTRELIEASFHLNYL